MGSRYHAVLRLRQEPGIVRLNYRIGGGPGGGDWRFKPEQFDQDGFTTIGPFKAGKYRFFLGDDLDNMVVLTIPDQLDLDVRKNR